MDGWMLQDLSQTNTSCIKKDEEKELGMEIADDIWIRSLSYVNKCSINARYCLIQFKISHRFKGEIE